MSTTVLIEDEHSSSHPHLHRSISLSSGTFLVIGTIIGSGIFSTPALVLQQVQSPGMSVLLWIIGGLICLFGTWSYVEWGLLRPKSGGEKEYLAYAFPHPRRLVSFAFCFTSILLVRPGACAADAIVAASYVLYAVHGTPKHQLVDKAGGWSKDTFLFYEKVIAVGLMVGVALIHLISVRMALGVQNVTGWIKLATLVAVVVCGALVLFNVITPVYSAFGLVEPIKRTGWWEGTTFSFKGYADALFAVLFTVDGWNNLNYSVEELKDPVRNLPRAALGGTIVSLGLFVLANVSYFIVLPVPIVLKSQQIVGADFFRAIFGPGVMDRITPLLIALSTVGAMLCMTFSGARLILCVAREGGKQGGRVASVLAQVSDSGTPVPALLVHLAISIVYIVAVPSEGAYKFLVEATGYAAYVFYGLAVYGLLWLRYQQPHLERHFKVWWPAAVLFVMAALLLLITSWLPGVMHDGTGFWVAPTVAVSTIVLSMVLWSLVSR